MSKPVPIKADAHDTGLGPVDENGQQILSAQEVAALDRLNSDPEYLAGIAQALADIAAGRVIDHETFLAQRAEHRARWLAENAR